MKCDMVIKGDELIEGYLSVNEDELNFFSNDNILLYQMIRCRIEWILEFWIKFSGFVPNGEFDTHNLQKYKLETVTFNFKKYVKK